MRSVLAAIPEGLIWYPAILVLLVSTIVVLFRLMREPGRRRRRAEIRTGHLQSVVDLVRRSHHDTMAALDLERRAIDLILRCNGYPSYSAANCRAFLDSGPPEHIARLVRDHLSEIHVDPGRRSVPCRDGLPERVTSLLEVIEKELEV